MTQTKKSNDNKLLFSIAAGVIAIAVGIAVLSNLGAQHGNEASTIVAVPAVHVQSQPQPIYRTPIQLPEVERIDPEVTPEAATTKRFVIDPQANFVSSGIHAYEGGRFDEAVAYFDAEANARPDRAWTHYILALSQWKAGDAESAAITMRQSLGLDADRTKAWINLARIENDRGEFDAALIAADTALTLEPQSGEALFLRARSLYNSGDTEAALEALETSVVQDPENGYAYNLAGLIWIERGEGERAAAAMQLAAQHITDVAFVQNNLGMALELSGRLDEAALAYARAVELSPAHERAALNFARLDGRVPVEPQTELDESPVLASLESEIPD